LCSGKQGALGLFAVGKATHLQWVQGPTTLVESGKMSDPD
jgi:hypothetical protein